LNSTSTPLPSSFSVGALGNLSLDSEDVAAELLGAYHEHAEAVDALSIARFHLAVNRAMHLSGNGDGSDSETRKARLRISLARLYDDVNQAERDVAKAKAELDGIRTKWAALHYRLRAFEVVTKLLGHRDLRS
jgi:hypothetical protein